MESATFQRPIGTLPVTVSGTIEPTRLSIAYRAGLVVVAVAMLLLPLIYLGLIGVAGAAVWWHVTTNVWMLGGTGSQWRLLAYAGPAVVGVALVFFMIKPILARPGTRQEPVPILPEAEPGLFLFIEQICRQVRAPVPRRVQVDCQVNASAGFMPGRFGMLKKDLVLTIGLPLAAGLSVRELGGVLAHEFGHFAQGGGMRLTALVRSVNGWFARVVYERDKWDQQLEHWSKESDWRLSIILVMARGAIWTSRRVLAGLMMSGHAISCFMMRQMEYDADSYEIKFAGSEAFGRTSARLREMGAAAHFGYNDLGEALRNRSLPANLPVFLRDRLDRLPGDVVTEVRRVPDARTGFFDTHPADADRVRAADAAAAPGVLVGGDGPATELFRDFDALGAAATRHHYEHDLGLALDALTLVDTDDAIRESRTREAHQHAMSRFFNDRASVSRPLHLPLAESDRLDAMALRALLAQARDDMAAFDTKLSEQYRRCEWLDVRRTKAFAAEQLLGAGLSLPSAADFEVAEGTMEGARSTQAWAVEEMQTLAPAFDRFEAAAVRRLVSGICLAMTTPPRDETLACVRTLNAVAAAIPHAHMLRRFAIAGSLLEHGQAASQRPDLMGKSLETVGLGVTNCCAKLRDALHDTPYPHARGTESIDVATWCGLTPGGQPVDPSDVPDRLLALYLDLLGRLTSIALEAEATLAHAPEGTG